MHYSPFLLHSIYDNQATLPVIIPQIKQASSLAPAAVDTLAFLSLWFSRQSILTLIRFLHLSAYAMISGLCPVCRSMSLLDLL